MRKMHAHTALTKVELKMKPKPRTFRADPDVEPLLIAEMLRGMKLTSIVNKALRMLFQIKAAK